MTARLKLKSILLLSTKQGKKETSLNLAKVISTCTTLYLAEIMTTSENRPSLISELGPIIFEFCIHLAKMGRLLTKATVRGTKAGKIRKAQRRFVSWLSLML
jgi:hypothetical protein